MELKKGFYICTRLARKRVKKREKKEMNYVLLEKIGKGVVKLISLKQLEKIILNQIPKIGMKNKCDNF